MAVVFGGIFWAIFDYCRKDGEGMLPSILNASVGSVVFTALFVVGFGRFTGDA